MIVNKLYPHKSQKEATICPLKEKLSYFEAREATKDKGGLPPNSLHEKYYTSKDWKAWLLDTYYDSGVWCREILAYPERNGSFRDEEIVSSEKDEKGRNWVLPQKFLPKKIIRKKNVALLIDPQEITLTRDTVVIHPARVGILEGRLEERLMPRQTFENLRIFRDEGVGVAPIERTCETVGASLVNVDRKYSVAYVEDLESNLVPIRLDIGFDIYERITNGAEEVIRTIEKFYGTAIDIESIEPWIKLAKFILYKNRFRNIDPDNKEWKKLDKRNAEWVKRAKVKLYLSKESLDEAINLAVRLQQDRLLEILKPQVKQEFQQLLNTLITFKGIEEIERDGIIHMSLITQ